MKSIIILLLVLMLTGFECFASKWSNESEVGVVVISGEVSSQTENLKHKTVVEFGKNLIAFSSRYLHLSNADSNTELWELNLRSDRKIKKYLSVFVGKSLEGRDYKNNLDLGLKYSRNQYTHEIGYRLTKTETSNNKFLRLYSQIKNDTFKFWIETLLLDNQNLQIKLEPSVNYELTSVVSLKMSYLYKYEKSKKTEAIYLLSLAAKY